MLTIDETTLTGIVRAEISVARVQGYSVDREVAFALALADLLELPDDAMFLPAVFAAMKMQTRLDDPANVAYTAKMARAAGYGNLAETTPNRQ
jgi:hypothetical protein